MSILDQDPLPGASGMKAQGQRPTGWEVGLPTPGWEDWVPTGTTAIRLRAASLV